MMQKLKINFTNFWPEFCKQSNIITQGLGFYYDVEISSYNPDVVFNQGNFGEKSSCISISWLVESMSRIGTPDYSTCDFSLGSCSYSDERHLRVPFWSTQINWSEDKEDYNLNRGPTLLLNKNKLFDRVYSKRNRNICSIAANPMGKRLTYYPFLNRYIRVDHAGSFLRNNTELKQRVGNSDYKEKIEFISKYKMNLCFENDNYCGYVCEKILHSFYSNTIPIYWGPDTALVDFNPDSFIHIPSYESEEQSVEMILDILSNENRIKSMIENPIFNDNVFPTYATPEYIGKWLSGVIL